LIQFTLPTSIPQDYWEMNITSRYDDPNMLKLQQIEDPYFYAERLTMPKAGHQWGGGRVPAAG
jgi:PhoPQ-activated pathogenicity-related protein